MPRLLAVVAALLVAPAVAVAQQVPTCGATITESITLAADLFCSGTALRLDGVATVDLNGFTVSSQFSAPCTNDSDCATIEIGRRAHGGGTLRNGRVSRTGVDGNAILVDAFFGISGGYIDNLVVDSGGLFCHNGGVIIKDSSFVGAGIRTDYCSVNISNNTFADYADAINIVNNYYSTVVVGNSITDGGISAQFIDASGDDKITDNEVRFSPRDGILVNYRLNYAFQAVAVPEVSNNVVVSSGGAGIRVLDGFAITLTSNVVLNNVELGIDAPGAIDGGGNRAGGNGNPLQCVGVVCIPDLDGDGIADESDNCAAAPNGDQSDTDSDGLGDSCDPAPLDPDSADAQCKVNYLDASQSLAMCTANLAGATTALGICNDVVVGTNGDLNGDGAANIVDTVIFRRWLAGYSAP